MNGFIEVTDRENCRKTLISKNKIIDITVERNGYVFITVVVDCEGNPLGIETVETYEQIKQLLFGEVAQC